jgi:hypothetical protein
MKTRGNNRDDTPIDPVRPVHRAVPGPLTSLPGGPSAIPVDRATPTVIAPPPAPLPRVPVPTPPSLLAVAGPGRRDDAGSDISVTTKMDRIEIEVTPAPLPPSPAAADADRWFEQVATNPAAQQLLQQPDRPGTAASPRRSHPSHDRPRHAAAAPPLSNPWLIPVLIAAISLTVGMILGALLFGDTRHPSAFAADAAPCDCSVTEPAAPAPEPVKPAPPARSRPSSGSPDKGK